MVQRRSAYDPAEVAGRSYSTVVRAAAESGVSLEYLQLGACALSGAQPEVTAEEGLADLALVYAAFESGLLGRPVLLSEVIGGAADGYQRETDVQLGASQEVASR